ncbi:MBL fold metallo-hydrolase [Streptomyces sp. t39]|uniref:MBL fold metallo-hydrolase n=1 Tax=Streptomyces sp. t39 TaxID=1828156 RepID=UPI0011CED2D1|nr:MBL fold metallo-hydrolase [Streptomyces sp. t39]TXS44721.1 MBL fold metallo-hydrolase [Streptomyces sp. t39]
MDFIRVLPQLYMFRFSVGQAYLWRDGDDLTLVAPVTVTPRRSCRTRCGAPVWIRRIVLTHCHRDHVGAAGELAARHGAQALAHRLDAPVVRGEAPVPQPVLLDWEIPLYEHGLTVPPAPPTRVDRELEDGDLLNFGDGARVVHSPGHTDGSIAVHLPHHGVLFTGDLVAGAGRVTPGVFDVDRAALLVSMRRLASLAPTTVCFGHGDPVTGDVARLLPEAAGEETATGEATSAAAPAGGDTGR